MEIFFSKTESQTPNNLYKGCKLTEKGSKTMVPEFKGRMPTSLSQEADGQLKNKNTVSIRHSKEKKCSHLCSCTTECLKKDSQTPKQPIKLTKRKMLPRSYDLIDG